MLYFPPTNEQKNHTTFINLGKKESLLNLFTILGKKFPHISKVFVENDKLMVSVFFSSCTKDYRYDRLNEILMVRRCDSFQVHFSSYFIIFFIPFPRRSKEV